MTVYRRRRQDFQLNRSLEARGNHAANTGVAVMQNESQEFIGHNWEMYENCIKDREIEKRRYNRLDW